MILVVLTTDGSNREDANVFYANHLLVDVPEAQRPQVMQALATLTKGAPDKPGTPDSDVSFDQFADEKVDDLYDRSDDLAQELSKAGFPATLVKPSFVIQVGS